MVVMMVLMMAASKANDSVALTDGTTVAPMVQQWEDLMAASLAELKVAWKG